MSCGRLPCRHRRGAERRSIDKLPMHNNCQWEDQWRRARPIGVAAKATPSAAAGVSAPPRLLPSLPAAAVTHRLAATDGASGGATSAAAVTVAAVLVARAASFCATSGAAVDAVPNAAVAKAASARSRSGFNVDAVVPSFTPPAPPPSKSDVDSGGAALLRRRDAANDARMPATRPCSAVTSDARRTMPRAREHCSRSHSPANTTNTPTFITASSTVTAHSMPVIDSGGCRSADVTPTLYCNSAVDTTAVRKVATSDAISSPLNRRLVQVGVR